MKFLPVALAAICLLSSPALAAPKIIKADPNKTIPISELVNAMGKFDAWDTWDMAGADTISFYHVPDMYNFDDYETACSAMDVAGLRKLRQALSQEKDVVKVFEDNGYKINDVVAIVHNPAQNSFAVYLR
jgi:hypothetical protein